MRKVAVFNDTSHMRRFGCDAVIAAIEANIAAMFHRILPAEVHRP